jgi:hypothetical protein
MSESLCRVIYERAVDPRLRALAAHRPVPLLLPLLVAWDRTSATVWDQPGLSMLTGTSILLSAEEKWKDWVGAPYDEAQHRRFVPAARRSACVCGKPGVKVCGRCKAQRYCGPECQKADWSRHKAECSSGRRADVEVSRTQAHRAFRHPCALIEKAIGAERARADRIFARLHEQRFAGLDWISPAVEKGLRAMAAGRVAAPPELKKFLASEDEGTVAFRASLPRQATIPDEATPSCKQLYYLMLLRLKRPVNDDSPCVSLSVAVTSIYGFLGFLDCGREAAFREAGAVVRVSRALIVVSGQRLYNYIEAVACQAVAELELPPPEEPPKASTDAE